MSNHAQIPKSPDERTRRLGLCTLAALPPLLVSGLLFTSGEETILHVWAITLLFASAVAAGATFVALAARDVRTRAAALAERATENQQLAGEVEHLHVLVETLNAQLNGALATNLALLQGSEHVGVLTTDASGTITACNAGAERLLGIPSAQIVGASILDFHVAEEFAAHRADAGDSAKAASDLMIWSAQNAGAPGTVRAWTWRRPDRTTRRVGLAIHAFGDPLGETSGFVVVAEDLTAQELANRRLHALEIAGRVLLQNTTLADALPQLLRATAPTFGWEHARVWMSRATGAPLRIAHSWSSPDAAVPAPGEEESRSMVQDAAATGEPRHRADGTASAAGQPRACLAIPLRMGGAARGVVDLSGRLLAGDAAETAAMLATLAAMVGQFLERKEAERRMFEAEGAVNSAVRAKSDFLALMSHEIRTPMNGVIGMSNLLLETELTPKQRDFARTIRSSGDSLLAVINDILDFSKMEAGKLPFEYVDFDLRAAVEDTLELMAGNAHAKHLELAAHVHADVPHIVHGDPNRLRQVLNNLVANAIKFTASGEVIVTVAREHLTGQHVVLRFAIRDTGIGIAPDVQKRLFQPFMQADTSTTRRYGGTGLGLAIAKQLVEQMHGRVGVVSEEGKGSTFHFTVRLDRAQHSQQEPAARTLSPTGARVLIVEDNAAHARILGQLVRHWGLTPTRAASVDAAVQQIHEAIARQEPFALALLDAELPDAAGTLLAGAISKAVPAGPVPHLVLLAGLGQQFPDNELASAGVSAWLTKPLREERLFDTLSRVLAGGRGIHPAGIPKSADRSPAYVGTLARSDGPRRILLVEDNIINQQIALQLLQRMGFTADVAHNGVEALAALRRAPYELVLMDCMMPQMDGYETTRRIREIERRRAALGIARPQVHIIALTANAGVEDRARCLAAGMNDFVSKPLRPDELQVLLERWHAGNSRDTVASTAAAVATN